VHQDLAIYAGELSEGERFSHDFAQGRRGWLHVARGLVSLGGGELREGDGAKIEGEHRIELDTDHRAEILLFDFK
jgi:redox-sensitive bicupin YhaK (pirin superfamily)